MGRSSRKRRCCDPPPDTSNTPHTTESNTPTDGNRSESTVEGAQFETCLLQAGFAASWVLSLIP